MCSDSEMNSSAYADQNHAPSLTYVRLELSVHTFSVNDKNLLYSYFTVIRAEMPAPLLLYLIPLSNMNCHGNNLTIYYFIHIMD